MAEKNRQWAHQAVGWCFHSFTTTATMPPKKKDDWLHSRGRTLLMEALRTGEIPLDSTEMSWKEAFQLHPEFAEHDGARLFQSRLSSARRQIREKKQRGEAEMALLAQDRQVFPIPATNHRGEPRWEGSTAQALLKQDVEAKKHEQYKPQDFYDSRPEYKSWPLQVIRKHIEQEVRLVKWKNQGCGRRK